MRSNSERTTTSQASFFDPGADRKVLRRRGGVSASPGAYQPAIRDDRNRSRRATGDRPRWCSDRASRSRSLTCWRSSPLNPGGGVQPRGTSPLGMAVGGPVAAGVDGDRTRPAAAKEARTELALVPRLLLNRARLRVPVRPGLAGEVDRVALDARLPRRDVVGLRGERALISHQHTRTSRSDRGWLSEPVLCFLNGWRGVPPLISFDNLCSGGRSLFSNATETILATISGGWNGPLFCAVEYGRTSRHCADAREEDQSGGDSLYSFAATALRRSAASCDGISGMTMRFPLPKATGM